MSLIITGIIDGPLTGGVPKAVRLEALTAIPDLSRYGIGSANNGGGTDGEEFTFPAVAASAGDIIYVASESSGFESFFGFAPDYTSGALAINGDDAIELFLDGSVIDVFGDVAVDGSGQTWEYTDGWAARMAGVTAPSTTFVEEEWTFSGADALDGATGNATASVPFPMSTDGSDVTMQLVAAEDFDGGALNLLAGFNASSDNLDGGPGDFFGVASIAGWPQSAGVPFSLADDSIADISGAGINPEDSEGLFGQGRSPDDAFFALADSDEFGTAQTASWTFDIVGYQDLALAIDLGGISDASFGGFSSGTAVTFTVKIDDGPEQTAFTLTAREDGSFQTRPMDSGSASGGGRLLEVSGDQAVSKLLAEDGEAADNTFLDKAVATGTAAGEMDTFATQITGTGATLTLTLVADVPFEALAFDNIAITGTEAPVAGSLFSIAPTAAVKAEGDSGTTELSFSVTRAGDVSAAASVDYAVTGAVDAADFGGALPAGTVAFLPGESTATLVLPVSGDTDIEPDEAFTVTLANPVGGELAGTTASGEIRNDDLLVTPIHEIQGNESSWGTAFGRTDATPLFGSTVKISAVVVGDFQDNDADEGRNLGGFFLQEEDQDADGDATTSEGIFVFENNLAEAPDLEVGDRVTVIGTATEFFGETQVTASEIIIEASGVMLPTPATLSFPVAETLTNGDGQLIADLEAYEGMLVAVPGTMTVADLFDYGAYGEIGLYADGRLSAFTQEQAPDVDGFAAYLDSAVRNTLTLNDGRTTEDPDSLPYPDGAYGTLDGLSSGDTVADLLGVIRYSRSSGPRGDENYRLNPVEAPTFTDSNPRQETPPDVGGDLTVAAFNVLNYFNGDGKGGDFPTARGADTPEEFARQQEKLVAAITAIDADVVGLIEIENDGYGPDSAIQSLVDALNAIAGENAYAFVDPGVPQLGSDAIAVGFIYQTASVVPVGSAAILDKTVDPRFDSDNQRPSLAQTFEARSGEGTFTAVVNHFKSKGSPVAGTSGDEDQRDGAGNANTTRTQAAEALADWLAGDPTGSGDDDYLILGDLNAYAAESPIQALLAGGDDLSGSEDDLVNLTSDYSYGFPADLAQASQVQAFGSLDYALGSGSIAGQVTGAAAWHINADEPAFTDYNLENKSANPDSYAPDAFRSSDHDPILVGLNLRAEEGPTDDFAFLGDAGNDVFTGGATAERFSGRNDDTGDYFYGEGGVDTAVFRGAITDYTISPGAIADLRGNGDDGDLSGFVVVDSVAGRDGTDYVVDVERLEFTDLSLALDPEGPAGQAFRLYDAAFDRDPDLVGMGYWIDRLDDGAPLVDVAAAFLESAEFDNRYGNDLDDTAFLELLYDNMLEREPDPEGFAYWLDRLQDGANRADVMVGFSESPEGQENVIELIATGIPFELWLG